MALVNFTNLDFDQIKSSIQDYLKSNSNFTDYDFEGSNLSTLIDVLAYNTYISSYNANMVSNEVFIDSATLRENVVSLARNIGYLPRSRKSPKANVSFNVEVADTTISTLTLKKGLAFNSRTFGSTSFSFSVNDDITVPVTRSNNVGVAIFDTIDIHEGTYVTSSFTVNESNPNQRFILNNRGIDTSTIQVKVRPTASSNVTSKYILSSSLLDVTSSSRIFFIQEVEDEYYEIIFGDGIFGKKLDNNNFIEVSYIVTGGPEANGSSNFNFSGILVDNRGRSVNALISTILTDVPATGGSDVESVNSIRNYAPRLYASQNRAVTASDYEVIIPKIYPEAESVTAFGGEELVPPRFGQVFITIKPFYGSYLSNRVKDNIKAELKKYSVAGIVPEILDLKYLYIEVGSNVYYNSNRISSADALRTKITNNINKYADSEELNKYGAKFKYSKYQKLIDESDISITSNITTIQMRRDLRISENQFAEYEICYRNKFHIKSMSGYNIKSSGFTVSGISNTVYFGDIPNANRKTGSLFLFYLESDVNPVIVRRNVGIVDYVKGEVITNPLNILSTVKSNGGTPIIELSAIPESNDVLGIQDLYLQIDHRRDVSVNVIPDNIESGSDTSGANYITSSSYVNESIVRK